jgi:hypothetical protein
MAIALHSASSHQPDFRVHLARNLEDASVVPLLLTAHERVSVMTTLVATIERSVLRGRTVPGATASAGTCSCGPALAGHGEAYNEEAFHHFVAIEGKRSEISGRPFVLLLVEFDECRNGGTPHIESQLADSLFSGLAKGLRDTDVIGWYRRNRIAGAILTDLGEAPEQTVRQQVTHRVAAALHASIPARDASLARVRIYQLPARAEVLSDAPVRQLETA